jgi:AcrR family transcriptional regulator
MKPVKRGPGGRPTPEQSVAIDKIILDGARLSFSKKGISNTSIDDLASKLKVSKHTIYRRYRSKTELLEAVVERDVTFFRAALAQTKEQATDPAKALRDVAFRYVELGSSREYAGFYLSVRAEAARSDEMRRNLSRWASLSLEAMRSAIADAHKAELLQEDDLKLVFTTLIDLMEGANNTLRLGEDALVALTDWRTLASQRWSLFARLMLK